MKFSDLTECPFCGYDEFYTNAYVYGNTRYAESFDGHEVDNESLYEGLISKPVSGRAYCQNCRRYLGNKIADKVGQKAEIILNSKGG